MKALSVAAAFAFGATSLWLLGHVVAQVADGRDVAVALAAGLGAVLAADAISGLFHWLCDTYFDERTPWIGPSLIEPFRVHHDDPLAITRRGVLETNVSNWLAVLPVLAGALAVAELAPGGLALGPAAFVLVLTQAVGWTNQVHAWAHAPDPPRLARWLQRTGLVLPPARHARHHRDARSAYCITTGWWNPALDRARVFERLERFVARVARASRVARRDPAQASGCSMRDSARLQ